MAVVMMLMVGIYMTILEKPHDNVAPIVTMRDACDRCCLYGPGWAGYIGVKCYDTPVDLSIIDFFCSVIRSVILE